MWYGLAVFYELIAGERRLRASKLAGLREVPALIKTGEESDQMKLELALIENIQREDLNAIDRAKAFKQLADEFGFKHGEIGKKVGRSREYVSNSIRLLTLPDEMQHALALKHISEGHTRPLLMLIDRPEQQQTLFKEIKFKNLTVRDAESIARKIAYEKVRKKELVHDPEIVELEEKLQESLGTRVHIERKDNGGRVQIDFFSNEDLHTILDLLKSNEKKNPNEMLDQFEKTTIVESTTTEEPPKISEDENPGEQAKTDDDEDLYSISNFSV